jgi:hypothetical protein
MFADAGLADAIVGAAFATAVGAWEATCADAAEKESATRSTVEIVSWYFIFPRLVLLRTGNRELRTVLKKKGRV